MAKVFYSDYMAAAQDTSKLISDTACEKFEQLNKEAPDGAEPINLTAHPDKFTIHMNAAIMSHDAVVLNYLRDRNGLSGVDIAVGLRKKGYDKPIIILSNNSADSIRDDTHGLVDNYKLTLVSRDSKNEGLYSTLQSAIAEYKSAQTDLPPH